MSEKTVDNEYLGPDVVALARAHTAEALGTILGIMREAGRPQDRMAAAQELLNRGHGKSVAVSAYVGSKAKLADRLAELSDDELTKIAQPSQKSKADPQTGAKPDSTPPPKPKHDPFVSKSTGKRLPFRLRDDEVTDNDPPAASAPSTNDEPWL